MKVILNPVILPKNHAHSYCAKYISHYSLIMILYTSNLQDGVFTKITLSVYHTGTYVPKHY